MIPLAIGTPREILVVAPHPDDEAIGAFGLMRRFAARGARIRVLVATDGAGSHRASRAWPRERLVAERRRETRRTMRRLGVGADAITFLGLPDGALEGLAERRLRTIARAVRRARRTDLIVAPAAADDHPDHRAVARQIRRAAGRRVAILSYLVWPGRRPAPPGPTIGLPLGVARGMKRAAIRRYRTQMGAIRDDPAGFAIAPHELRAFARPIETFRRS